MKNVRFEPRFSYATQNLDVLQTDPCFAFEAAVHSQIIQLRQTPFHQNSAASAPRLLQTPFLDYQDDLVGDRDSTFDELCCQFSDLGSCFFYILNYYFFYNFF